MWTNLLLVVGVLAAVTVGCLLKRSYDGRFRSARIAGARASRTTGATGVNRAHEPEPMIDTAIGSAAATSSAPVSSAPVSSDQAPSETGLDHNSALTDADLGEPLGERATLVQFSSAFCAPCRATRTVLADIATKVPGVRHIEVDAESHLGLVRRLGVVRTPTTFVVDASGRVRTRASGLARRGAVVAALDAALDGPID